MSGVVHVIGVLLSLLLSLSAWASGDVPESEVSQYLQAATRLHENLEFERALQLVGKAKDKARNPADDERIALLEGVILSDLGKSEDALQAFRTALSLNPSAKLPLVVAPAISASFERLRMEMQPSAPFGSPQVAEMPPARRTRSPYKYVAAGITVGMAAASSVLWYQAWRSNDLLLRRAVAPANAAATRDAGIRTQNAAIATTAVTAVGAGVTAWLFWRDRSSGSSTVVLVPTSDGGAFVSYARSFF